MMTASSGCRHSSPAINHSISSLNTDSLSTDNLSTASLSTASRSRASHSTTLAAMARTGKMVRTVMTGRTAFRCTGGGAGIVAAADRAIKAWIILSRATITDSRPARIQRKSNIVPRTKTAGH